MMITGGWAFLAIWAVAASTGDRSVPSLSAHELLRLQEQVAAFEIFDIRGLSSYMGQRLAGAQSLPFDQILRRPCPRGPLSIVYCSARSCGLSLQTARALMDKGCSGIYYLEGGLEGAAAAGFPVEGGAPRPATPEPLGIGGQELEFQLSSATPPVVVDLRSGKEFRAGHLPSARNIPLEDLEKRAAELPPGYVVLYDRSALRGRQAALLLMRLGRDVAVLEGGISVWGVSGRPIKTD